MRIRICALIVLLCAVSLQARMGGVPYTDPADFGEWQKFRKEVVHPVSLIKPEDLERAKRNMAQFQWAAEYAEKIGKSADEIDAQLTPEFLDRMVEVTTAGSTTPCPACRDLGKRWLPNNVWKWNVKEPEKIVCVQCKTAFPNEKYPETIKIRSKWDPRQEFTFIDGDTFSCFGYRYSRSNPSGIIRAFKQDYVISKLDNLAVSYALNGKPAHAKAVKRILLKVAEVLPTYLVRVGYTYNEYADCDPHEAARNIYQLPEDEIVAPPNIPDRKLWTGYWSASRFTSAGMDGSRVISFALAYDLTYNAKDENGKPVYSEEERLKIEKDVILEAAYLGACDTAINNKSVGNRAGVAAAGLVLGHPGMVRFGLDGFVKTVEDWFLPDGGTSESAAYAIMTMRGIYSFAYMFRNYTEPAGYLPPKGAARLVDFNVCRDTCYGSCWQSMIWTLQGNLKHPPLADSYKTTSIPTNFLELIALAFPAPEHYALLQEQGGGSPKNSLREAIFYREPVKDTAAFTLPDVVFPQLGQGFLRLGENGRDAVAVLDASNWGIHHHYDSLNLYLWKDGHELLSDLGYLWDHPDKKMTTRSYAHNLVLVDGQRQKGGGRNGSFHFFAVSPTVKAMRASSNAYAASKVYERTVVQVDKGAAGAYWLDWFKADGGKFRDYIFHGPNNDYTVNGLEFTDFKAVKPKKEGARRFAVRMYSPVVGSFDVCDVEIRPVLPGNKLGDNLAKAFPTAIPGSFAANLCIGDGYGLYIGNGKGYLETVPGRKTPALRMNATETDGQGILNVAFVLGSSNGYNGQNAMATSGCSVFEIRLWVKSSNKADIRCEALSWKPGREQDLDTRRNSDIIWRKKDRLNGEWQEWVGRIDLEKKITEEPPFKVADGAKPWNVSWKMGADGYRFTAYSAGYEVETVKLSQDWGQRDSRNRDRGATLPYIRRTRNGAQADNFVTVFAAEPNGIPLVKNMSVKELDGGVLVVDVNTPSGRDSFVFTDGRLIPMSIAGIETDATLAVVQNADSNEPEAFMLGGTKLKTGSFSMESPKGWYSGKIGKAVEKGGDSWFELEGDTPKDGHWIGQAILVKDPNKGIERAYPVGKLAVVNGVTRVYTKVNHVGFTALPAATWRLPCVIAAVKK